MHLIEKISDCKNFINRYRKDRKSIGFVPTMGFLHKGHLSLARRARAENDIVIVSIFVNPTQFGPNEDFEKYPRNLKKDLDLLRKEEEVDIVFVPSVEEMYGSLESPTTSYRLQAMSLVDCLCGKSRPGHFEGVCQVVEKLFNIIKPDKAYFGQKDYQQCLVIRKMVEDLKLPIKIVICPTVREKDGLAMSSRNVYLNEEERRAALVLYRMVKDAEEQIKDHRRGGRSAALTKDVIEYCKKEIQNQSFVTLDYFEIRDAEDLSEVNKFDRPVVIAGAIRAGETRLIDNVLVLC